MALQPGALPIPIAHFAGPQRGLASSTECRCEPQCSRSSFAAMQTPRVFPCMRCQRIGGWGVGLECLATMAGSRLEVAVCVHINSFGSALAPAPLSLPLHTKHPALRPRQQKKREIQHYVPSPCVLVTQGLLPRAADDRRFNNAFEDALSQRSFFDWTSTSWLNRASGCSKMRLVHARCYWCTAGGALSSEERGAKRRCGLLLLCPMHVHGGG